MKYLKITSLSFMLMLMIFGCIKKGFIDVNNDPNRVNDANITPELIFPQAAQSASALLTGSGSNLVSYLYNWVGYYSVSGDYSLPGSQTTYDLSPPYTEPLWDSYYNTLYDLNLVKTRSLANGDTVLTGASMVLSAKLWQELVDMFGDVPYSQAFQNSTTRTPKYDKAAAIYTSLQKVLDSAITYLNQKATSGFVLADIVNKGNQTKWIKLANTLKLRLLIRQSEVPGLNPVAEIAKIVADGGVLHAGETVSINPGYTNSTGKQNPYYASWGLTTAGADAIPSERANAYIVNILKNTADPRLYRFFLNPASGGSTPVGTVYGLSTGNPLGAQSSKTGPGLVKSASQDQWIMPSFESMFLEAEAIARGWFSNPPYSAQTAYENAVRESFVWLGVPDAINAANTYMANNPSANWANAGSTPASQARFIATQKYIALTGIDPLESWSDIRRLGILPDKGYISVNPGRISSVLPVRLPYPQSEYVTNSVNVNAEGTINLFTSKIFWQP